jgi:predicted MFS family arabinose efflux permease
MIPLLVFSCAAARSLRITTTSLEVGSQDDQKADVEDKAVERRAAVKMLLKQPSLQLTCLAMFMIYFGLFAPIFYLPSFAVDAGFSTTLAFYTASIVNGASFLGRILPGFVADRYGKFNCIIVATLSSGVVILCWTRATSVAGLVLWSAAYGFVSGVCPGRGSTSRNDANIAQSVLSLQQACAAQLATLPTIGLAIGTVTGSTALS